MFRHECIATNSLCVNIWASAIADSEQLFHAKMLFSSKFKREKLWLICEVILTGIFVVEGVGVYLKEFLAIHLIVNYIGIGKLNIMNDHKFHCNIMFVITCGKIIVELFHLSSKMTASQ